MTITIERDHFVAWCDAERGCAYNTLLEQKFPAQLQQPIALDLSPPLTDEALHANDGRTHRRSDPRKQLTAIERRQLEAFVRQLIALGWIARDDRARPLGYYTVCKNHNPATAHRTSSTE